jgi:hypothetical protein
MHVQICRWLVWFGVAWSGAAQAAPEDDARAAYERAVQLVDRGEPKQALVVIGEGLAIAPDYLPLLGLEGTVLLGQREYAGALVAYQAYLDAGAAGANRREALQIVKDLSAVQSTFLAVLVENGPADIYLDSKTHGVFCTAAPSCNLPVMPGEYRLIAERPGFERWTRRVVIERDRTTQLPVTLVEQRSLLTVRVDQPGARVTVDGAAHDAPAPVAAGTHRVVVSLAGHRAARREITAHGGTPVELDVALTPLVAVRVEPAGAALRLDDQPVALEDGGLAIPPGAHVLVASAHGFEDRRIDIPAERAPDYQLAIELANAEPGQRRLVGAGGVVLGTIVLGVGLQFGENARHAQAEVRELCGTIQKCPSQAAFDRGHQLMADAQSQATRSTLFIAAGGTALAAGAILWLTARSEHRPQTARVVPILSSHDVGLVVAGGF